MSAPTQPLPLDQDAFYDLTNSYHLIHGRQVRPELLRTADDAIAKCFWQRKRIQRHNPASRFISNASSLNQLGIQAPDVSAWYCCDELAVQMVIYPSIPGRDLRDLTTSGDTTALEQFPDFLADLHARGIYFRAIHLANVLHQDDNWALIDVADLQFKPGPLGVFHRARNLSHLLNVAEDRRALAVFGEQRLIADYCRSAGVSAWQIHLIKIWVQVHRRA